MNRQPPVHLRQPRAPQAVPAHEARYATGFAAGAVLVVVCGLIVFSLVAAAMTSTTAFAIAMFLSALLGATLIGLWSIES